MEDYTTPVAVDTLSLFSSRPVQTVMESYQILQIRPINENISTSSTIDFEFPLSENATYYELGSTLLYLEFETYKSDAATKVSGSGTGTANYAAGTFINMPTSSFFSDVHLTIYDKPCESCGGLYPYQAMIHDMLMYSKSYRKEVLKLAGYFDEMCKEDDAADTNPDSKNNPSFVKRNALKIANSESFVGRVNLGMFKQPLKIPTFAKIKLTFTKASLPFVVLNPDAADGAGPDVRFILRKMFLEICTVDVACSVFQAHIDGLKTNNFHYHFTHELVVSDTVPTGAYNKSWTQVFPTSQVPKLIVMTLVRSDAFTGSVKYNPFHFQTFDLSFISLKVNSKPMPYTEAFRPSKWTNNKYLREYKTLEYIGGIEHGISPLNYVNGQFFMIWNLCPDLIIGGAAEANRAGPVSLELQFSKPLAQPINIIMYAQFDNCLEITRDKDIIRNWI